VTYNYRMEPATQAPLTPEQFSALTAGGGYALCEDPGTQMVYHLVGQAISPTIDDDYVREKLAEAQVDIERNGLKPWDVEEIKEKLRRRLALKPSESR